jgi:hypothetical protein
MKGYKYSILSLVSSSICIVGLLLLLLLLLFNYNLSLTYLASSGKTQALFGIIGLTRLYIKLYFIPLALASIILGIIAMKKKEIKWLAMVSIVGCIIATGFFFIRVWTYMI